MQRNDGETFSRYLKSPFIQKKLKDNYEKHIKQLLYRNDNSTTDVVLAMSKLFDGFSFSNIVYSKFNILFNQIDSLDDIKNNKERYLTQILVFALSDLFESDDHEGVFWIKKSVFDALNDDYPTLALIGNINCGEMYVRRGLLLSYLSLALDEIRNNMIQRKLHGYRGFVSEIVNIYVEFFFEEPFDHKKLYEYCDSASKRNLFLCSMINNFKEVKRESKNEEDNAPLYFEFEPQFELGPAEKTELSIPPPFCSTTRICYVLTGGGIGAVTSDVGICSIGLSAPVVGMHPLFPMLALVATFGGSLFCGILGCVIAPKHATLLDERKNEYESAQQIQSSEIEMEDYNRVYRII